MKKWFDEFKDFIARGNVIDLAVGVIIGAAFSALVNSVVNNIIMPPLGLLFGNADFSDYFIVLRQGEQSLSPSATLEMAKEVGAVTWNYGQFITDLISFLLLALGVFLIIKGIMAIQEQAKQKEGEEEAEAPIEKECPYCYKAIPIDATRCPYCTSHLESVGE